MKTAIYIEDGVVQLVITPESEFEKNALSTIQDKPLDVKVFSGSFYDCRGGWIRQSKYFNENEAVYGGNSNSNDQSIILRVEEQKSTNEGL